MAKIERVEYKGELRIIGIIVDTRLEEIGYVIMNERTKKFKHYTIEQTKWLLQKFKFSNAEYEAKNSKIVNTECAMHRLIKFNTNLQPLENTKAMILGKIITNGKSSGFRILSPKGTVVDISEKECLALINKGIDIVNAKLVSKGNNQYISAIKEEFTAIIIEEVRDKAASEAKGISAEEARERKRELRNEIKLNKIKHSALKVICNFVYADKLRGCKQRLRTQSSRFDSSHEKKLIKIIVEELCTSEEDKRKATDIVNAFRNRSLDSIIEDVSFITSYRGEKATASNMCIWLLMQLLLTDQDYINLSKELTCNIQRLRKLFSVTTKPNNRKEKILTTQEYKKYLNSLLQVLSKLQRLHLLDERVQNCISLVISKELSSFNEVKLPQFGCKWNLKHATSDELFKLVDSELVADTLHRLKLNISSVVTPLDSYNDYLDISLNMYNNCRELYKYIGDVIISAKIDRILKYDSMLEYLGTHRVPCTVNSMEFEFTDFVSEKSTLYAINYSSVKHKLYYSVAHEFRATEEEMRHLAMKNTINEKLAKMEVLLAVLAIYNPGLAKILLESINDSLSSWRGFISEMLPNFDFDSVIDYGLSDCCEDYYKSGLCAIKISDGYLNIKRKNLSNNKNIREEIDGYNTIIKELASVVGLITSNRCTPELIERFIWDNQVI